MEQIFSDHEEFCNGDGPLVKEIGVLQDLVWALLVSVSGLGFQTNLLYQPSPLCISKVCLLFAFFEWRYIYIHTKGLYKYRKQPFKYDLNTPYSAMQIPMSSYPHPLPQASGLTTFAFLTLFQPMPQHTAKPVAADPAAR